LVGLVVNEVNDRAKNTKINNDYYYSYYYGSDENDHKTNEVKESFIKRLSKKLLKFLNK